MTHQDPEFQRPHTEPAEERLQADPMLRRANTPWGWGVAIGAALVIFAVLLLATNRDASNVADAPGASPPAATTGSAPTPPDRAKATKAPAERSTTGAKQ